MHLKTSKKTLERSEEGHFLNFKPILGQIPEFEFFGSFFSLKLDNFDKLCIKNCNRNPRDGSFFEIFYEIWPIIIIFLSFAISLLSLFSLQWFWNFHCFIAMNKNAMKVPSIGTVDTLFENFPRKNKTMLIESILFESTLFEFRS